MNIFLLPNKFIFFLLIQIKIINSYQYIYYKNRLFPANVVDRQISFVLSSSTSNSTDTNETDNNNTNTNSTNINTCIASSQGDYFCDSTNNNEYCLYDGGDCCQGTCRKNCANHNISDSDCICGSNSYNCISQNTSCYNCQHGKCETNMSKCYSEDEYILTAIQSCNLNSFSQGNENTSNYYCGLDNDTSTIHLNSDTSFHFPGCGIDRINCTELPCCEVVKLNRDTNKNCNYTENFRYVYNENTLQYEIKNISCMEYYRSCFQKNAKGKSRGQCCQCYESWGGTYCDVPLCENCVHGKCVDVNKCECDENYYGPSCNIPICSDCINGVCINPNECECFYGYSGKRCDVAVTYPFCVHGIEKKGDQCECEDGFYGKLCEIKICDDNCDFCDDDGNCYEKLSDKCEVIDPNCLKCEDEKCLECKDGYFLNNNNDLICVEISKIFDNCLKGNLLMCTECDYPYVLNNEKNKCVFGGIVEIGQKYFDVMLNENIEEFNINFYRFYSSGDFICSVNYEIFPVFIDNLNYKNNPLDYFPNKKGILTFDKNETKKNIILPVFNYNKYFNIQNNESLQNVFFINIYNPKGGCIIGEVNNSYLEIFDDEDKNNIFINKILNIKILNINFNEENNSYDFYSEAEEIKFELSNENILNENKYFILISVSDNLNKKINFNLLINRNFENIKYEFLKDDENNDNKKIDFNLCFNKSKLFNISFYNYATLNNNKNDFSPFFIRINNSLNIDYYYIENNKTFYSFLFEFYFKIPENNFYLKIVLNKNDFVVLLINNIEIKLNSSEISNEILNNIYLIKIEDFNLKSNFLKINIKFIHLYGNNYFNVFYSENNVDYVNINDCNLNIYSCQNYKTFNINIH